MEPGRLLLNLSRFAFPGEVLRQLDDKVLVQWTTLWRKECIETGVMAYRSRAKQQQTRDWVDRWIQRTRHGGKQSRLAPLIDNADDWKQMREQKYAGDELLKWCHPKRRIKLSQHIICACLFDREIHELTGGDTVQNGSPTRLRAHLKLLQANARYRDAYYGPENQADLNAQERFFAAAFEHAIIPPSTKGSIQLPLATHLGTAPLATADAYGRFRPMQSAYHESDVRPKRKTPTTADKRFITQNVRVFKKDTRQQWLSAWRRTPLRDRPDAWCVQETHVHSLQEAEDLELTWRRLWGLQNDPGAAKMSYWSIGEAAAGGVAILLTPKTAALTTAWYEEHWTQRRIGVRIEDIVLVNIYAPNHYREREDFFQQLMTWEFPRGETLLVGDFNSVQSPHLDRLGDRSSSRPESAALEALITHNEFTDARTLMDHAEEDSEPLPTDFYTYWAGESASRIDRFYVPTEWTDQVQWVSSDLPVVESDHQMVGLHLLTQRTTERPVQVKIVNYPIRTGQKDKVLDELLTEMTARGIGQSSSTTSWDLEVAECIKSIRKIKRKEYQRRDRLTQRIKDRERAHTLTRTQLMQANLEDQREEHLMHVGQLMQRSMERLRWDFRRVADWERDQAVTKIDEIHGPAFVRHMNTADKFASEWSPILGASHRTIKLADLSKEFKQFVRIPRERELSTGDNEHMMGPITEAEILAAIAALNRHKAAGPDGLNNDFYKDTQALMVPALERVCNGIMNGDEMPPSFLEALIIPLRKKGDSADAMDYRPISLLQTSYKIFAKVLATQLQAILPRLIGHSQQGFVHGRQMQKTVMMMLAQLLTAEDEMNVDADSSRIIPLLDFKNAYDTVDREFIYETLRAFGFNEAFIDLMRRMHTDTSASFLVNGEQSKARAVESGIRQGCPLAPLLFLLAAEILGLAIQQNPDLTGLPVPSLEGVRHIFSAFVDDSTVFLERATQLKRTMELVRRFGALSGLHVQPTKSQIIFLNTAIQLREYGGIAVLQHSDTVRYLGYEVETGQLTNKNWVARIRKIQRRLATATRIATNVENRVLILNAIVLPSILFTAAVFEMPAWAEKEICNITKQFLWKHATGTEVSRNKVNPGLLVTPKKAGGVGLASFTIAIKTQYIKHAIQWPLQRQDAYFAAWRTWAYRGVSPDIARHPSENKLLANQNRFR